MYIIVFIALNRNNCWKRNSRRGEQVEQPVLFCMRVHSVLKQYIKTSCRDWTSPGMNIYRII